ncbi:AMP-binding protein [Marinobacterium lutimaris]|uniref:Fatty-acyl-CoA synthase n=1 Tax=Marinobacterium lutimaris TaxID=568106 RepID=A0A1H6BYM1_9GAMM|nr:AMP-binding protein [Marinobacterium lutimaris]SEG65753.1 fatty-acyl-CoA synthase [Marinobacterium lutimaris]
MIAGSTPIPMIRDIEAQGLDTYLACPTPFELIAASAAKTPDALAIRYVRETNRPDRDELISYADLVDRIQRYAAVFRERGVVPGTSVAILGPHTPSTQIALWAAELAGAAAPINPMLKADHVVSILKEANARCLLISQPEGVPAFWDELHQALKENSVDIELLCCDSEQLLNGIDCSLEQAAADIPSGTTPLEPRQPDDLAAYYHTGGTTGTPKLVQHNHRNEAHVAVSCARMFEFNADDILVNGFPLFHVAGAFVYGLSTLSAGATLLIPGAQGMRNREFLGSIWQQIEDYGITAIGCVPTILSSMDGVELNADISSLRMLLTGGSPLPTELADALEQKTGKPVRNIFGMTESAGCIAVEPLHKERKAKSCGFPLPFVEARVVKPDNPMGQGSALAPGESGLLIIRGPNISAGYKDPNVADDSFLDDGWLSTGDIGTMDEEGRIFITGRSKDIIIRGAHNIDPQQIESALISHPAVRDAAAVGMPDTYAGELPVAFVTLVAGAETSPESLMEHISSIIDEPVAIPKEIVILEDMPTTQVGKIFKPALRRIAIRHAIDLIARAAGLNEEQCEVTIDDKLRTRIFVAAEHLDSFKKKLTGMPIDYTVTPITVTPVKECLTDEPR